MAVARVPGYPDYTSSGSDYIPIIFGAKTLVKYYANSVIPEIANTDYDKEIKKYGDEVIIRGIPNISITDYAVGDTVTFETPTASSVSLLIDKAKKYAFKLDKITVAQSDIVLSDKFTEAAGQDLKVTVDTGILADIPSDAHADNQGSTAGAISNDINMGVAGAPKALTKDNITDFLDDESLVLSEKNVPDDGNRYSVLPAWACSLINRSDLSNASFSGDDMSSMMKKGFIGRTISGLKIYSSNLLATTADGSGVTAFNAIFGHKDALVMASQLTDNEFFPQLETTYGSGYKGLYLYGYKVVKPEAFGWAYIYKG